MKVKTKYILIRFLTDIGHILLQLVIGVLSIILFIGLLYLFACYPMEFFLSLLAILFLLILYYHLSEYFDEVINDYNKLNK